MPGLVQASQSVMDVLLGVLARDPAPPRPAPSGALAAQLTEWAATRGAGADASTALRAVRVWSRVHGLVSLEIGGSFASMGVDADLLLDEELRALVQR